MKGNFGGNWLGHWVHVLLEETLTVEVEGYGLVTFVIDHFEHDSKIQGTSFEGRELVDEGQVPKIHHNGKVVGVLYWNVDRHVISPPPIPTVILAPWIARESAQSF